MTARPWLLAAWLIAALAIPSPAQTDQLEECLSRPEFQHVLADLFSYAPTPRLEITRVRFRKPVALPRALRRHIASSLKSRPLKTNEWIGNIEARVRDELQQAGYYEARVQADPEIFGDSILDLRVTVNLSVQQTEQFRMGGLRFLNLKRLPAERLAALFPLRQGDIYDVAKVRSGVDAMRRLYSSLGYLDFTAVPRARADRQRRAVALDLDLEEGQPFHVGSVRVLGLEHPEGSLARCGLAPSAVYSPDKITCFYRQNAPLLPPGLIESYNTKTFRNDRAATVDIVFDVRQPPPCGLAPAP